jgi:hypothetical protein
MAHDSPPSVEASRTVEADAEPAARAPGWQPAGVARVGEGGRAWSIERRLRPRVAPIRRTDDRPDERSSCVGVRTWTAP